MSTPLRDLGITLVSTWYFNCYVIHDGGAGRPFVVDLGLPSQVDGVAAALRRLDASLDDVSAAVATHGHVDHVGGLPALAERSRAPIALPERIRDYVAGEQPRTPGPAAVLDILPVLADQPRSLRTMKELAAQARVAGYGAGASGRFPFEGPTWLADGDRVPGAPAWEVVHSPGHTDDSTSLYHAATRTLISGDAVLTTGGRGWFNPELVDAGTSALTERRLRDLPVEHLLPGHGLPVTGEVWDEALSWNETPPDDSRLKALWRIVRGHHRHA